MTRYVLAAFILLSFLVVEALADTPGTGRGSQLAAAALERTSHQVTYDGRYRQIAYPMGDVAPDKGVCTDVVIRSYRALGIDLQQLVHEDMKGDFAAYPPLWGLFGPDSNIDHRRVPNMRRYFEREGAKLPVSEEPGDYLPGDLVTWNVAFQIPGMNRNTPHIGVVSSRVSSNGMPLVVHNIGRGPKLEDMLFKYHITGHYRYLPKS